MLLIAYMPGLEDKSKKSQAERVAFDLLEYLDQINYNKYYDSMGSPGTRGGEKEKLFSDFSSQSIKAAQASVHWSSSISSLQVCISHATSVASLQLCR